MVAREGDALSVLGALERLADRDARVLLIVAHDRDHVLVAGVDEVEEPPADLRLEEPEQLAVPGVHGDEAVALAELGFGAGRVLRHDLRRCGVDEPQDPGLAHVLDEETRLGLGLGRVRLRLVLEERPEARDVAQRDRVVRLGLQHVRVRGLRLIELAGLEERAAEPVAGLEVFGIRFEDLRVQLDGLRPIGLERGLHRLVRESTGPDAGLGRGAHGQRLLRRRTRCVAAIRVMSEF